MKSLPLPTAPLHGNRSVSPLIIIILMVMMAASAGAQIVGPDQIRIFWDTDFTQIETQHHSFPDTVTGYLVIDQPTRHGVIRKWQCELYKSDNLEFLNIDLEGKAENISTDPIFLQVNTRLPIKNQEKVLLATFQLVINNPDLFSIGVNFQPERAPTYQTSKQTGPILLDRPWSTFYLAWGNTGAPNIRPFQTGFGTTGLGYPITKSIAIKNIGTGLICLDFEIYPLCNDFSVIPPPAGYMLPPLETYYLEVTFNPSSTGEISCFLRGFERFTIIFHGRGRDPLTALSYDESLRFDTIVVHSELEIDLALKNIGDIPIIIDPIILSDCPELSIRDSHTFPDTLNAQEAAQIRLTYAPTVRRQMKCDLQINPEFAPISLDISSRDSMQLLIVNPTKLNFLTSSLTEPITKHIQVSNEGDLQAIITPNLIPEDAAFRIVANSNEFRIDPGERIWLPIEFAPTAYDNYTILLKLGQDWPSVPITATSAPVPTRCVVLTRDIEFEPVNPGSSKTNFFTITNGGLTPLVLNVQDTAGLLTLIPSTGTLLPGDTILISALFAPQDFGEFSGTITLGPSSCHSVAWSGQTEAVLAADENIIGFYFDHAYTHDRTTITTSPRNLTAYLVLHNPSVDTGVAGWECRVDISAGASFVTWDIEGLFVNPDHNNEFTVGLGGQPLPYSEAILLGSFQIAVVTPPRARIAIELLPKFTPTIPGHMAWLAWDDLETVLPMVTATGKDEVAWIYVENPTDQDLASTPAAPPAKTRLLPNVPNPFNPRTEIRYELKSDSDVNISIYDLNGRRVRTLADEFRVAGAHQVLWSGRDDAGRTVSSGAYYVRLLTNAGTETHKVTLLK